MSSQYLIISADGARTNIYVADSKGLVRHLEEASEHSADGGRDPVFLTEIVTDEYGSIVPGQWHEGTELILRVEVVVPQPVTVKWSV